MTAAIDMRSEAVGELKTRSAVEMRAFDSLPRIVRDALNDMVHGFPASEVKRVLARLIASPRAPARELSRFWQWSELLLDPQRPRAFNQALMDLGATVCMPRNPSCALCPWQGHCAAYAAGDPAAYPVKDAPRELPFQVIGPTTEVAFLEELIEELRELNGLQGGRPLVPGEQLVLPG